MISHQNRYLFAQEIIISSLGEFNKITEDQIIRGRKLILFCKSVIVLIGIYRFFIFI